MEYPGIAQCTCVDQRGCVHNLCNSPPIHQYIEGNLQLSCTASPSLCRNRCATTSQLHYRTNYLVARAKILRKLSCLQMFYISGTSLLRGSAPHSCLPSWFSLKKMSLHRELADGSSSAVGVATAALGRENCPDMSVLFRTSP